MKVILAKYSGFCFGVRRAVELAEKSAEQSSQKVYSYGELIHNEQAVRSLEKKGVFVVEHLDDLQGESLIIRSHGVARSVIEEARALQIDLIDATCPFVKKIQQIVCKKSEEGYSVLILGDKNHPEVIGIEGWCKEGAKIIASAEELREADFKEGNYVVVAQTTFSAALFKELEKGIRKKIPNAEIYNTICTATNERQEAVKSLAQKVDAMIIVGGRKSSNTKKLAEISERYCPSYLIETAEEIEGSEILKYETVGLAAGASTPDFVIEEVREYLSEISDQKDRGSSSL